MYPRVFTQKPSTLVLDAFLETQRHCDLTYDFVGCANDGLPKGFDCDHYRVRLGQGQAVFSAAENAIRAWHMFPSGWTKVIHQADTIEAAQTVAVLIRVYGFWWLNSARIVYVIDDTERRYGFAYGTLPGHVECGEERFLVERDEHDLVWYDLRAISRPRHWLTRMGYPLVRRLQRRFANDSQRAMIDVIAEEKLPDIR